MMAATARRQPRLPLVALAALSLVPLSGCKVGPDFRRPASVSEDQWIGQSSPSTAPADTADWWKVFNDPTLNALVNEAWQHNLSLQQAGARVLQAQAQLNIAIGELFPQQQAIGGSLTYQRQSRDNLNIPGLNPNVRSSQIGLSASWELDFWGKYRRGVESDRAAMLASVAAYDNALVSLTASVANAYFNIRTLQQRVQVANDNLKTQQESLRIAKAQFENGETSLLDVQQATTQLAETQSQIPGLQSAQRKAADALAVLLGTPPDQVDAKLGTDTTIATAPAEVALGMPRDLLRRRPDVRQAELTAAAQSAGIGVAKANLYPAFSLGGTFGWGASSIAGGEVTNLFKWDDRNVSVGPSFVFPILNYGRIVNSVRVQDAAFQQAVLNYQNTVLTAQQEVEDARAAFSAAQSSLSTLNDAAVSARKTTELAIIRYKEGAADYTTVLSAEQAQLRIEDALASGKGNVPLALVGIYRALGGGWQLREGHDLVSDDVKKQMRDRTHWGSIPDSGHELPAVEEDQQKGASGEAQH